MAIQLQTIRDKFSRYKHDVSDIGTALFTDWADAANKMIYRYLSGLEPDRFRSTQTYSVVSSPSTQALPTTFKESSKYSCGFYVVSDAGLDTEIVLPYTGAGSTSFGYYFDGSNVVFTGIENTTIKLRYLPENTVLDDLTDYFTVDATLNGKPILPNGYEDLMVKFIDVYYTQWDEDPQEGVADARFTRLLDELARTVRRHPGVYTIDDYTTSF